jgi:DNA-binding MarR family transcriptional regulator
MEKPYEESFFRLIALTGLALRSYADQRLKIYDLTVEQLQVLKQADVAGGQPQNKLSLLTSKSPANMTRILDRLEKKDRIVRRLNPDDRRSSLIFLTKDGKALKDEVISLLEGLQAELVAGIPHEKQLVAIEVLSEIKNKIDNISQK